MDGAMNRYPPEFWRWVGWKARERTKILERLGRAMRLHATNLQLALEVHQEAVTDPRAALVYYGKTSWRPSAAFNILCYAHHPAVPPAFKERIPRRSLSR